ncbi:MAG: hypothetical protein GKR87_12835 [Kiritimatiellae bacterium]|nr:hypothetical protein [Kiritimatiellia bacterium]
MVEKICIWVHVLTMIGAFGGLLHIQVGLPVTAKNSFEGSGKATRFSILLISIGFVLGFILYYVNIKTAAELAVPLSSRFHMLIGIKLILLFMATAFLGIGTKKLRQENGRTANTFRVAAIITLAMAAYLGVSL